MYNRYIQQQDGSYRKNRMPEQSPPRPEPPHQEPPPPPPPSRGGQSAEGFLRSLLPKNLDTGDLAVVLLLLGVCAWGVLGHLDTTVSAAAVSAEGQLTIYVNAQDGAQMEAGMPVRIGDGEFTVAAVGAEPVTVDEGLSDYALYVGGLQRGQWVYTLTVTGGTLPDGVYEAQIVVESVAPMSFVTN